MIKKLKQMKLKAILECFIFWLRSKSAKHVFLSNIQDHRKKHARMLYCYSTHAMDNPLNGDNISRGLRKTRSGHLRQRFTIRRRNSKIAA